MNTPSNPFACYVTGTDTGIGKTVASVALIHALRAQFATVAGMKPVASGCEQTADGWRNADALALQAASRPSPPYHAVNPWALRAATAPEIAAAAEGRELSLALLDQACAALRASHQALVVEGVGGWLAPLSTALFQADLVRRWQLPVVLVVGLRLGCINHALLSARAIAADGLTLLGWIGNAIDPALDYPNETRAILQQRLPCPCLGFIEYGDDAAQAAARLNPSALRPAGIPA